MKYSNHSDLIKIIAKEYFEPIGVSQKGKSRTWIDDNCWWVGLVEFQPSSWSKGTYLNVGVNFQWYPNDFYSFDIGDREGAFVKYSSDKQFEAKIRQLAKVAKEHFLNYRKIFSEPESAKNCIVEGYANTNGTIWGEYHQGMIYLIVGDLDKAIESFGKVTASKRNTEWADKLRGHTKKLVKVINSGKDYFPLLNNIINESRSLKKLNPLEKKFSKIF